MPLKPLATALLSALALAAPAQAAAPKPAGGVATLAPSLVLGGEIATDPQAVGQRLYVPTGRVVTAWNYLNPGKPVREGASLPVEGVINGLAAHGNYLYATWHGWDGTAGFAVFSIANPAAPTLVHQGSYTDEDYQYATGIAVANDHLYLFDSDWGVFISDLADPARPEFVRDPVLRAGVFSRVQASGNQIRASGRNWFGNLEFHTFDVTNPTAPVPWLPRVLPGLGVFGLSAQGDIAIGAGYEFATFDLSVPGEFTELSRQESDPAMGGATIGNRAYTFGFGGLQTWDLRNPAAPRRLGVDTAQTLGARHYATLGQTLVLPTATDLLQAWSTRALVPKHVSGGRISAGTAPYDVAEHDGRLVLLQNGYGLTVNDAQTLATTGRYEADLPQSLQERAFEAIEVQGDVAYLASWGAGLFLADLSGNTPVALGRFEYPLLSSVAVAGDHAYLIKHTNGDELVSVDVSNPASPVGLWTTPLPAEPFQIATSDGFAYIAEGYGDGTGGLRVYSLADPEQPAAAGYLSAGCAAAFDLSIDAAADRAYLACEDSLKIVDISTPTAPVLLGGIEIPEASGSYGKVAHRGNKAWFGDLTGLYEFDVSNPAQPVLVARGSTGRRDLQRLKALADGRLAAVGSSGVHLCGPATPPASAPSLRKAAPAIGAKAVKAVKAPTAR